MTVEGDPNTTIVTPSGVEGTIDMNSTPEVEASAFDFTSIIPEEYKDKGYMKDIDSVDKLFKKFDGAEKLVGSRPAGIPMNDASPEEWDAFFKATGRPDTAKEYEIAGKDEAYVDAMKELYHKVGLTAKQAKALYEGNNDVANNFLAEQDKAAEKRDAEFDEMAKGVFGDREAEVMANAKKLIADRAPEGMKAHIDQLDNKALVLLAGVLDGVKQAYIKEDDLLGMGSSQSTQVDLRARGKTLINSDAYNNSFHPEHDKVKKEVAAIYAQFN